MINKIQIKNFQAHKITTLELHPGVNAITGNSDTGKSSIFRALYWTFKNRPQGFAFKSHFSKKKDITSVKIEFSDSNIIERKRNSTSTDDYVVNNETLKAMRGNVPDEVQEICNLQDYNLHGQHDSYFVLQDSPGEIARKLNEVVGLDEIDRINKNVNRIISESKRDLAKAEFEEKELQEELKQYKGLDIRKASLDRLKRTLTERETLRRERTEIKNILKGINDCNNAIEQYDIFLEIEDIIKTIQNEIKIIETLENSRSVLSQIVDGIKEADEELQELDDTISVSSHTDIIIENYKEIQALKKERDELGWLLSNLNHIENDIESLQDSIDELSKEISEIGICPILGEHCEDISNR